MITPSKPIFVLWILRVLVLCSIVGSGTALATIKISGSADRSGDVSKVTLSVEITNVSVADVNVNLRDRMLAGFKLSLSDHDNDNPIAFDGADKTATIEYYSMTFLSGPDSEQQSASNNYKVFFTVLVSDNGAPAEYKGFQELLNDNSNVIRFDAEYQPLEGDADKEEKIEIKKDIYVANEAPSGLVATAKHLSLNYSWDAKSQIAYNGSGGTKAPTGVTLVLIDTSVFDEYTFKAKTYKENAESEAIDASCKFVVEAGDPATCSIQNCVPDSGVAADAYLDPNAINEGSHIQYKTLSPSAASYTFTELIPGTQYAAFAVYQPSGLKNSSCVMASPIRTYTLTELNGADEGKRVDPRCFIGAAAYGTQTHDHLDKLRWFRDVYLMPTTFGRMFVESYYEWSPPIANFVREHPIAQYLTVTALAPLVGMVAMLHWNPQLTLFLAITFLMALVAAVSRTRLAPAKAKRRAMT